MKKVDDGVKQSCVKEEEPGAEKKQTLFADFLAVFVYTRHGQVQLRKLYTHLIIRVFRAVPTMANVRTDGTYKGRNETMLMFMDFWLSWRKFLRKEGQMQMQHDNDNYG